MKRLFALTALALLAITSIAQKTQSKLVWSDEFNYTGLPDSTKWGYDLGSKNGWGNNELQYYTKVRKNARVENGHLIIEAHKEKTDQFNYTSARLVTRGKASWSQGRIEVRAKLPAGRGSWPAIWMLAENMKHWPDDEIGRAHV